MMNYDPVTYPVEHTLLIFDIKACRTYVIYNTSSQNFHERKKTNKKYDEENFPRLTI